MRRRQFLGLMAALAAAGAAAPAVLRLGYAQATRERWWPPQPFNLPQSPVVLEWRYLAGRITEGGADYGFVVSVASYNAVPPFQLPRYELLVARQGLSDGADHASRVYVQPNTTPAFDANTYRFDYQEADVTWALGGDGVYSLSVSSPELSLGSLTLHPVSDLIAEGGDGDLPIAAFGSALVNSDYYNDWVVIKRAGEPIGYGRLDIQTLRPTIFTPPTGFSHHWFAVAGRRADGEEVWLSAYELISEQTFWYYTLGRRAPGGEWRVESLSYASPGVAHPLTVEIRAWQPQLRQDGTPTDPPKRTGVRWRVRLGRAAPGDVLDLDLPVLPGQFLQGARISGVIVAEAMQEAVGTTLDGSVGGAALAEVYFTLAESTYSEPQPADEESYSAHLPLVQR
jgi:hypothetical protein